MFTKDQAAAIADALVSPALLEQDARTQAGARRRVPWYLRSAALAALPRDRQERLVHTAVHNIRLQAALTLIALFAVAALIGYLFGAWPPSAQYLLLVPTPLIGAYALRAGFARLELAHLLRDELPAAK